MNLITMDFINCLSISPAPIVLHFFLPIIAHYKCRFHRSLFEVVLAAEAKVQGVELDWSPITLAHALMTYLTTLSSLKHTKVSPLLDIW